MPTPKISDKAILFGFDSEDRCVYSEIVELSDYYDGEHVWDKGETVLKLKLRKMQGFLFDAGGDLYQRFESNFDVNTGVYQSGFAKWSDGTVQQD